MDRWLPALLALLAIGCRSAEPVPARHASSAVSERSDPAATHHDDGDDQHTELSLPFTGTWIVSQGYDGAESHRGLAAHALDLVALDVHGRAYRGRGRRTRDWFSFGAEALATADGTVVRAIDHFADNPLLGRATHVNTVIIEHGAHEFSEYVHLQRGSLRVREGERVQRGQVLARAGNSGAQTPHLHWALLSSLQPIHTRPAVFAHYEVRTHDGRWQLTHGTPREGELIRPPQHDP